MFAFNTFSGKFTNIAADWPGCTHDSHIFITSELCSYLERTHRGLVDGLLLGGSGYACRPFLMTPYINPVERHQRRYNSSHVSTRSAIERTFGVWKRRFHCSTLLRYNICKRCLKRRWTGGLLFPTSHPLFSHLPPPTFFRNFPPFYLRLKFFGPWVSYVPPLCLPPPTPFSPTSLFSCPTLS